MSSNGNPEAASAVAEVTTKMGRTGLHCAAKSSRFSFSFSFWLGKRNGNHEAAAAVPKVSRNLLAELRWHAGVLVAACK